jgi:glycerol-3-phosphate O-acyltransferase/dihydroxyacetone phosphate acyltransferase
MAAWRVLIGVWGPKRWDLSGSAVEPWTKPRERPANEWIQPAPKSAETVGTPKTAPSARPKSKKRPASRGLIRHVLRARLNASRALASYLEELQRSDRLLLASQHIPDLDEAMPTDMTSGGSNTGSPIPRRSASAVIGYLRSKGAKIAQLNVKDASDWAALSSDGEPDTPYNEHPEDLVWVSPRLSS